MIVHRSYAVLAVSDPLAVDGTGLKAPFTSKGRNRSANTATSRLSQTEAK